MKDQPLQSDEWIDKLSDQVEISSILGPLPSYEGGLKRDLKEGLKGGTLRRDFEGRA